MRRRKPNTTVQVNLRIKEELRRQLEAAAKEHQLSFNRELTARLADSLEQKTRESLAHTARHLEAFLKPLLGQPIDTKTLENLLTRLTGIGKFDSAGYTQIVEDGRTGLLVTVSEKSYAPPTMLVASECSSPAGPPRGTHGL